MEEIILYLIDIYQKQSKTKTNLDEEEESFGQRPAGPPPKRDDIS